MKAIALIEKTRPAGYCDHMGTSELSIEDGMLDCTVCGQRYVCQHVAPEPVTDRMGRDLFGRYQCPDCELELEPDECLADYRG